MKRTESKEHDLSVEISFLEGLRKRMPQDAEVLKFLADAYTKDGRWQEGLDVDLELARLFPRDSLVQYNLACSLSLLGRLKESAEKLAQAILFGYKDWDWLREDPDLANLRKSPEFALIVPMIESKSGEKPNLSVE